MIVVDNKISRIIRAHKSGQSTGIASICSANHYVIKAAVQHAKQHNGPLLIEATSNQVDQFGGYTGLTPELFKQSVLKIAGRQQLPPESLIFGGDHLGPNRWQSEDSGSAMAKAKEQISAYIKAGFLKIHLDASMKCADDGDRNEPLDPAVIAERSAILCKAAEDTASAERGGNLPVYIIGTDVPPPGGARGENGSIHITAAEDVGETIELTRQAFQKYNLNEAWERVTGVVVQPGVEFGDDEVFEYETEKSRGLVELIENYTNLVYEAHSTDYQKEESLRQMVRDHFAILKVGPWLTYKFREAVFALSMIEEELLSGKKNISLSNLMDVTDRRMQETPEHWNKYYTADEYGNKIKRRYSYSDRIRYYWADKAVNESLDRLIQNLSENKIPYTLISQYLPEEYPALRDGIISEDPEDLILHRISGVLDIYYNATTGGLN